MDASEYTEHRPLLFSIANPEKLRHIGPVSRTWHLRWRGQSFREKNS